MMMVGRYQSSHWVLDSVFCLLSNANFIFNVPHSTTNSEEHTLEK